MPAFLRNSFLILFLLASAQAFAQAPTASFTASPTSGCIPLTVQFNATASTSGVTYNWVNNLGNGTTAGNNPTPSTTYLAAGTYTVQLQVSNSNGTSSIVSKTITVHDTPKVDFAGTPIAGCPPLNVNLSPTGTINGAPGGATYQWVLAGSSLPVSGLQNPVPQYTTPGTYNVVLTVTNSQGCFRSKSKSSYITVYPKPTANFTALQNIFCSAPAVTDFNSTVNGGTPPYTYNWSFGPPNVANPTGVSFGGTPPVSHNVTLTVTDANNCQEVVNKPGYIQIKKHTANFSMSATSGCRWSTITFTNTSTSAFTTCAWYDGATQIGVGSPFSYTFVTAGVHNIKLVSFDGPCPDTIIKQLTIHPKPTLNFSITPKYPCPPPNSNVTFVPSGTCTSFQWNFDDAGPLPLIQSTAFSPTHNYAPCNFYCPTLIGTDANGCKDTVQKIDSVRILCDRLQIDPARGSGCIPLRDTFVAKLTGYTMGTSWCRTAPPPNVDMAYPFPITSYEWKFWDKNPAVVSNVAMPIYIFDTCGIHKVTLKATTANGCTFYDTFEVYAGSKPDAGFYTTPLMPLQICPNDTIQFTDTTDYPCAGLGNYAWEWDFGDGKIKFDKNPKHVYDDTAGTFCIRLIARYNGCFDTMKICDSVTIDSPIAKFTLQYNCDTPLKVKFFNKGYGFTSLQWNFGYGTPAVTSTQLNPVHTFPAYGTYTIKLTTFNTASGCMDTVKRTITLMDPKPFLTATDTTICPGDAVRFTTGFTNPSYPVVQYWWFVNNTLTTLDSLATYTHTFPTTGYHKVHVMLEDIWGCIHTFAKDNWVLVSKPTVDFTATPPSGCTPLAVNFTSQSTSNPSPGAALVNRYWVFGNSVTLNQPGTSPPNPPTQYYHTAGAYDVKLVVTDASGCKDSVTKIGYINAYKPVADFTADDVNACIDQPVNFTNMTPNVASATWDFGDGTPVVTSTNATHSYTQVGSYTVTMVATDNNGCKDTIVKPAHIILTKPNASFNMTRSLAICPPLVDTFTNTSSPGTYVWDFDKGNGPLTIPSMTIVEAFVTPKKYNVTLIVTDAAGCKDTASAFVDVLGYSGAFSYTPLSGCKPLEVTFTTTLTNIPSIIWDFNDGNTLVSSATTVTHTYTSAGKYVPKMIMSNGGGCTSSSIGEDTIKVDGVTADYEHSPACVGYEVTLTDKSTSVFSPVSNQVWELDNGNGTVTLAGNPVKRYYPKVGSFPVKLMVVNANGCKDTLTKDIYINDLPVISAGADTIICLKDAAQLRGSGGVSYVWGPANTGLSCVDCPNPLASPVDTTQYFVIGTDANGCSDTDQVVVKIKYKVTAAVGKGSEICDDEPAALEVSGAQTYEWTPADVLNNASSSTPIAKPHTTTNFRVVSKEGSCIPDTDFVKVVVFPKPTVSAKGATTIIAGSDAPINAEGDHIRSFLWKPSETLNCSECPNPIARPNKTTKYVVIATTEHNCQDSADVTIKVICDQSQLFIPNTFTPNGDGMNDVFLPRGVGFDKLRSFRVYNRWGEVVFEKTNMTLNDKAVGWDGTFRGQTLPPDVFVYTVEADCDDGEVIRWKGDITLIR